MASRNPQTDALLEPSLSCNINSQDITTTLATDDCNSYSKHPTKNAYTIRISDIPRNLSKQQFLGQLASRFPDSAVLTSSLVPAAATLNSYQYNTATVTFNNSLPTRGLGIDKSWPYIIDDQFYGLTPLSCPEEPKVDIVAVTGLAGHAFGSWKSRKEPKMWLRDYLPQTIPEARIMTYGYDTKLLGSQCEASIIEHSQTLLESLQSARSSHKEIFRPLILIGHSLGGLVIKKAIVDAAQREDTANALHVSCRNIYFFSVPHRGMELEALLSMIKGQRNERLVRDIQPKSTFLETLHGDFHRIFKYKGSLVTSVYETKTTPTVKETAPGRWERTGTSVEMVSRHSATGAAENEDEFGIEKDHSEITKFSSSDDPHYAILQQRIWKNTHDLIRKSFWRDDNMFLTITRWLTEVDEQRNHREAVKEREPGTGCWFIEGRDFEKWLAKPNSFLWLHGIHCGISKSVSQLIKASSSVIESLHQMIADECFAYFYCDHRDLSKQEPLQIFGSLSAQLCWRNQEFYCLVKDMYYQSRAAHSPQPPKKDTLVYLLVKISESNQMTLVIDAIDECGERRKELLQDLVTLRYRSSRIRILTTGRELPDMKHAFKSLESLTIHSNAQTKDIHLYLTKQLEAMEVSYLCKEEEKSKIVSIILRKASGMFLLAKYLIKRLRYCATPGDLQDVLDELPEDLDDTFIYMLADMKRRDKSKNQRLSRRVLMWLVGALRPLKLEELAEVTAVTENDARLNKLYVVPDVTSLERLCGSLVRTNPETNEIQLSHFSIKEFLISGRLGRLDSRNNVAATYHMDEYARGGYRDSTRRAQENERIRDAVIYHLDEYERKREMAAICLTYLAFDDFETGTCSSNEEFACRLQEYRFLEYAATFGGKHLENLHLRDSKLLDILNKLTVSPPSVGNAPLNLRKVSSFSYQHISLPLSHLGLACHFTIRPFPNILSQDCSQPSNDFTLARYLREMLEKSISLVFQEEIMRKTEESKKLLSWLQVWEHFDNEITWYHPANISSLYFAALYGWIGGVELIIERFEGTWNSYNDLDHALRAAAIGGHVNIVRLLLSKGANPNFCPGQLGSALQSAAFVGQELVVKELLNTTEIVENMNLGEPTIGLSALHGAAINADNAAEASMFYGSEITPSLLHARGLGRLGRLLLDVNCVDNVEDQYGTTLQLFSFYCDSPKARLLLSKKVNVNARGGQYGNAIQAASISTKGDTNEITQLLLSHRANPNPPMCFLWDMTKVPRLPYHGKVLLLQEDAGYRTQSMEAFFGPAIKRALTLCDDEHNHILLLFENEPTHHRGHYNSPLQAASFRGKEYVVKQLLEAGASVDAEGGWYGSSLHAGVVGGNLAVVALLLQYGAAINSAHDRYGTALQASITMQHSRMARYLFKAGANPDITDIHGWTARICAEYYGIDFQVSYTKTTAESIRKPAYWSFDEKSPKLELLENQREVKYCCHKEPFASIRPSLEYFPTTVAASIRADHPVPPLGIEFYFEIHILENHEDIAVGIGLSDDSAPLFQMPGWHTNTWGYHGDDGCLFSQSGFAGAYLGEFGAGDVVGCGFNIQEQILYFTLNGSRHEQTLKLPKMRLYPMLGMDGDTPGQEAHVRVNFGEEPFVYNLEPSDVFR